MRPKTKSQAPIGTVLSGRYRISFEIGRGGMAAVYEAEHIEIGKRVAVKVLDRAFAKNDTVIERFLREARAAAAVNSANICDVFDVGRLEDGRPYLVMELLEGHSLYDRMVEQRQLKVREATRVVSQVGRALTRAHAAGIVHRDLKPENIFLHKNSEGEEVVKLVDFGLAKFHAPVAGVDERLTREGALFGTPLYMSPEQVSGQGHADHRSDLWALGCIVFECLTGRPIWSIDDGAAYIFAQIVMEPIPVPSTIRPELPRAFDVWFHRALQRDPAERFQNARQMVLEMATALGHNHRGLVSAPALIPGLPMEPRQVIVTDSRSLAESAAQTDAFASTEPPPPLTGHQLIIQPPPVEPKTAPHSGARSIKRTVALIFAAIMTVAAGIALGLLAWRFTLQSPAQAVSAAQPPNLASAPTLALGSSVGAPASSFPVSLERWAKAIRQAQRLIVEGQISGAIRLLERVSEKSDHPALLNMLDHVRIAGAASGPCSVVALGRPRPFDTQNAALSAFAAPSGSGSLVVWTQKKEKVVVAQAIALDASLTPTAPSSNLTPKALKSVGPSLALGPSGTTLLYVDAQGRRRGAWLQRLDASGRANGEPLRVSDYPGSRKQPSLARDALGGQWVAYTDRAGQGKYDVFVRQVRAEGLSKPVRLTAHGSPADRRNAAAPRLVFAGSRVVLVYVRQTSRDNEVVFHRAGTIEDLSAGKPSITPSENNNITVVSETKLKVLAPSVACGDDVCFVAWRNQPSGTHVAAIDPGSGKIAWRKTFASAGTDVVVANKPDGASLVVWFDRARVRAAPITGEGMGKTSIVARVHGNQGAPSLIADSSGAWLTAWTCFEGGRPEAYVAKLRCESR